MLYKILFCVAVLLIGTPFGVQAQEVSPLVVETLIKSTTPTTVRTGESFTQVYKISYIYSERWGKEVLILEDEMKPKAYPASLGDFDIIGWSLGEPMVAKGEETDEYTRHLYVTLRIISPKKDAYVIPKFEVLWALRVGEKIETQEPRETEEVYINYVTTVTKNPYLDIRDGTDFGDYSGQANLFWYVSRIGAPSVALISIFLLISSLRAVKRRRIEQSTEKLVDESQQEYVVESAAPSFNKAYGNFFREIDSIANELYALNAGEDVKAYLAVQKRLFVILRDVLVSSLENINPGDCTASGIGIYIEKNIKTEHRKKTLLELQKFLANYQRELESSLPKTIFKGEVDKLKSSIHLLKRHWRILAFLGKKV